MTWRVALHGFPAWRVNLLDLIILTILDEGCKQWSSSLWNIFHFPFSSLLGPNIQLRILFSNTLSLYSSLNVRDHVSQPYSTPGSIIVLYILYHSPYWFYFIKSSSVGLYGSYNYSVSLLACRDDCLLTCSQKTDWEILIIIQSHWWCFNKTKAGRSFRMQYTEHIKALTQPVIKLNFAERIFNTNHAYTNIGTNL